MTGDPGESGRAALDPSADLADPSTQLVLEEDGLTLAIDPRIARRAGADGVQFVLRARTNLPVDGGAAAVRSRLAPDPQPIGTWRQLDPQRFEILLAPSELATLLSGANLYLTPQMQGEDAEPFAVQLSTALRVDGLTGYVNMMVELWPYAVDGGIGYRLEGKTPDKWYGLGVFVGGRYIDATRIDDQRFTVDLPEDIALAVASTEQRLELVGASGSARIVPVVGEGELRQTDRGPLAWYQSKYCWNGVKTCLNALPAGTRDLGSCGSAMEVLSCSEEVGVRATAEDVEAGLGRAGVSDDDAKAIVGAARAVAFQQAVAAEMAGALGRRTGAWYLDAPAVQASLDAEVDRRLGTDYARPFDRIGPPATLRTDDPTLAPDIAADALLLHLLEEDLIHSEFDSPLDEIVRTSRGEHVDVLRQIRSGQPNEDEPYTEVDYSEPPFSCNTGWLGAYIEITVGPDHDASVYFEID